MSPVKILHTLEVSTTRMFRESGEEVQTIQNNLTNLPDGLTCVISFNGDISGQVVVFWKKAHALKFSEDKMKFFCGVDVEYTEINDEVIEVIAEFTNEIAGAFLTSLSREDISIKILTPIINQGGHIAYPTTENIQVVLLDLKNYQMHLGLLIDSELIHVKH